MAGEVPVTNTDDNPQKMASKQMTTEQETVDWLMKSLKAFVAFAVFWVLLDLTASVVNPLGLLSLGAGLSFLATVVAMLAVLAFTGSLLQN